MDKKVYSYLGFASKSRNLIAGYNTCIMTMNKGKMKLLIISENLSENSQEKLIREAKKNKVEYRVYGTAEELSKVTGKENKGVFGINDENFACTIKQEIDREQLLNREVF